MHPPAPERVEQQLEQQEEQQPVPELSRETKPRVMAPFRRVAGLFAGTVMGVNEDVRTSYPASRERRTSVRHICG